MMYVSAEMVRGMEERYEAPRVIRVEQEISPEELAMVRGSQKDGRAHDVTWFIFRGDQVALIRKPSFPAGAFRAPSGGLRPGETLEEGSQREALEETGLGIRLERYLLRVHAAFTCGAERQEWTSHVFSARAVEGTLEVRDTEEIEGSRWGTVEELQGPIRRVLVESGRGLLAYRVRLTDEAVEVWRAAEVGG